MMHPKVVLTLPILFALSQTVALADNWSRFRGPNGQGVAADKEIPVEFTANNGVLWKLRLPGLGNSSPVVWGERLFVHTATPTERILMCLDAATGKTVWKWSMPGAKGRTHSKNTLASSTPVTDGQVVVNAFWDGQGILLAGFDMDGKPLWKKDLGPWISQHGPGASPVLYQDKVIYVKDMDYQDKDEKDVANPSTVWVLNKKTGATVWSTPREAYRACYSAPFLLERPDAPPELLITSTTSIRGYDPDSGQVKWEWRWSFPKMPLRTTGSSILHDGMLFACAGDGGGDRYLAALRLSHNGGSTRAELAWENKKDFPYVPTLLARGEYLYFVNDKISRGCSAGCFHAATGKMVWLHKQENATFTASPVLIDGKMYAPSEEGDVYVFAAEPAYRLLAKNSLGDVFRGSPAVANGRLYLRGQQHLFCVGKR